MILAKRAAFVVLGLAAASVLVAGCEGPEIPEPSSAPSVGVYTAWQFDAG